jgi:hypothetical protein
MTCAARCWAAGARSSTTPRIEGVCELVVRLTGVIRREFVMDWLRRCDIPALDGRRPVELITSGEIARVQRLVSELEDPGAV